LIVEGFLAFGAKPDIDALFFIVVVVLLLIAPASASLAKLLKIYSRDV